MKSRWLLALLAWLPAVAHSQVDEGPRWLRLDTAHFTFFTDGPKDVALSTAYDLEQLRYVLTQLWPDTRFDAPVPTLLYVFDDGASSNPYRLRDRRLPLPEEPQVAGVPTGTVGYLVPHEHGNYAALVVASETRPVGFVYKQYILQLLHDKLPALPPWLRHGLAEYYSTFEVEGETASIGLPIRSHLHWLLPQIRSQVESFSLAGIFAATQVPADNTAAAHFFQRSWAMVFYLSSEPDLRRQLGIFARKTANGVPPDRAFDEAFDFDLAGLEERLVAYLRGDRFNYLRVEIDRGAHPAKVSSLALHEAHYHLGDLLAHASPERRDDARANFQRALQLAPGHGPSRAGLGYVAELAGDDEAALAHYRQAVEQARGHFLVEYLYGASVVRSFGGRRPADPEQEAQLKSAVAALERSVAEWQDFAPAWALLGYAHNLDPEASVQGVEALENAHGLLPGRLDVAFNLLLAYARVDNREAADAIAARLRVLGADAATLERSREVLLTMDFREAVRLVRHERVDDAIAIFARIQAESRDPALQERAAAELEKFESTLQARRFSDLYQEAVRRLAAGETDAAVAVLGKMEEIARSGRQREEVEKLRQAAARLQAP